jgi:hypothetical protein
MKALCVSLGKGARARSGWLTLHREYRVLAILALPGRTIEFRVLSDDGHTPILVDSTLFAASEQPLPEGWVCTVTQDGVVELGPKQWLKPGFWEEFFDRDPHAVEVFRQEIEALGEQ